MLKELKAVEKNIQEVMHKVYKCHVRASIQLPSSHQGKDRPNPDHPECARAFRKKVSRVLCDTSDRIMKWILNEAGNVGTIGYKCHRGVTNTVFAYFDKEVTQTYWYVFLGQFGLIAEDKCKNCTIRTKPHCRACEDFLLQHGIRALEKDEWKALSPDDKHSLKLGLFVKRDHGLRLQPLDIPQLIACKSVAEYQLDEFFSHTKGLVRILRGYVKDYGIWTIETEDGEMMASLLED